MSKYDGNVDHAEAEVVEWGLQVAIKDGLNLLIVEYDSHMVVELVNNRRGSRTKMYCIISEIYALKMNFNEFKVQHTSRLCNGGALNL